LIVDTSISWDQIVEVWYQKAALTSGLNDAKKPPRTASAYVMKTINDWVIDHMDGIDVVFAYYIPSLKGEAPVSPPKRKEVTPPPTEAKPIALKVIEMTSGEIIELPSIAKYGDAIPTARQMARVPEDWIATVIENKPSEIVVACAPPGCGLITPEKDRELGVQKTTSLSVIPRQAINPKSVIVVMTCAHLNNRRKTDRHTQELRVENDQTRQELLGKWIERVRAERTEPWAGVARKMSVKEPDYQWFTGSEDPLVHPWYDHERITFKDPPRSSTEPVEEDEPEAPSFGPGANGPPGPKPLSSSSTPPSDSAAPADGGPLPFTAHSFTVTTVVSRGNVDVNFRCIGREIGVNLDSKTKEKDIQRLVANSLQLNLNG
jgi:hypothetical protein